MAKKVDKNYILFLLAIGFTVISAILFRYSRTGIGPLNMHPDNDTGVFSQTTLGDTSFPQIVTNYKDSVFPIIFEAAYFDSTYVTWGNETSKMVKQKIGVISLPTGRLVAGDHVMFNTYRPFNMDFPKGKFDVELSINKWGRASFIRIIFSNAKVANWEYPEYYGENRKPITDAKYFPGFGVDAGMAFIADSMVHQRLLDRGIMPPFLEDKIANIEFVGSYSYANFLAGEGDGFYASYVGFDKKGYICRFLIDFNSIRWL